MTPDTITEVAKRAAAYKRAHAQRDDAIRAALRDGHRQADVARAAGLTPSAIRFIAKADKS